MQQELKLLDLNDVDIKVYLALLELGESLASGIIWSIQGKAIHGHQDWHTTVVGSRRVRTGSRIYKSVPGWDYCEECKSMIPHTSNNGVPSRDDDNG